MSETRITKRRTMLDRLSPADDPVYFDSSTPPSVCYGRSDAGDLTRWWITPEDYAAFGEPEQITVTIEPGDLLNAETDAWPFKPGDVVLDSGEDADHTAWLEAAPERTVVSDCDGDEWTRKNDGLWWMNRGRTARAKSSDLTEQVGPLIVVSVPEATR